MTADELESFSGNYWNDKSLLTRKIYVKDGTLRYSRSSTNESILKPVSKNEFKMMNVGSDVTVKFYKNKEGHKMMSFSQDGSEPSISKEYQLKKYSSNELLNFAGVYNSKELDVNYTLKVIDGTLTLFIKDTEVSHVKEIMANLFSIDGYGIMQFNTDNNGKISDFKTCCRKSEKFDF